MNIPELSLRCGRPHKQVGVSFFITQTWTRSGLAKFTSVVQVTMFALDQYRAGYRFSRGATDPPLLFGYEVAAANFTLVDEQATMFSDTGLPLSPEFAKATDRVGVRVELREPGLGSGPTLSVGGTKFKLKLVKNDEKLPC